ncbi:MAG: hypothetical protein LBI04_12225, partial [Treponema sp.]|nr:hypothetical protein [Treponema sp.]
WALSEEKTAELKSADSLVLVLSTNPTAGMQLVWQDGETYAGWHSTDILDNYGAAQNGAAWNASTKTLTIPLATGFADYEAIASLTRIQIIIAYDGAADISALGIARAFLVGDGDATFIPHNVGIGDGLEITIDWDDPINDIVESASDDSYFEIVLDADLNYAYGFGGIATYFSNDGGETYSCSARYTMNASDVNAANTLKVTKAAILAEWEANAVDGSGNPIAYTNGFYGGFQIQIYDDNTTAKLKSITFYEKD